MDLAGKGVPKELKDFAELARYIRAYRGEVAYTDAQVGRLVEGLDRLGLADSTAIVLTADHGEGLGDHNHLGHGWNLHDELVSIPLILQAPGLSGGRRLEGPAQLEDLMPTILSLVDVAVPEGLDGIDLLPWLRGRAVDSPRDAVYGRRAAFPDVPVLFYERQWPSKWIGEAGGKGRTYALDRDKSEHEGVAVERAPQELLRQLATAARERERILDENTREALEALGYL